MDLRFEEDKMEYYGSIDGILPTDYPETYYLLNNSICIKGFPSVIYAGVAHHWRRMCGDCYEVRYLRLRERERDFDVYTNFHNLCSELFDISIEDKLNCHVCKDTLLTFTSAVNCQQCIEQFLLSKPKFENAERTQKHYEEEVIVRIY